MIDRESVKGVVEIAKDPAEAAKEAGAQWISGALETASRKFMEWFTTALDGLALGGMMVGCFLYMVGIRRGGKITWAILAVYFLIKCLLYSAGI